MHFIEACSAGYSHDVTGISIGMYKLYILVGISNNLRGYRILCDVIFEDCRRC